MNEVSKQVLRFSEELPSLKPVLGIYEAEIPAPGSNPGSIPEPLCYDDEQSEKALKCQFSRKDFRNNSVFCNRLDQWVALNNCEFACRKGVFP